MSQITSAGAERRPCCLYGEKFTMNSMQVTSVVTYSFLPTDSRGTGHRRSERERYRLGVHLHTPRSPAIVVVAPRAVAPRRHRVVISGRRRTH